MDETVNTIPGPPAVNWSHEASKETADDPNSFESGINALLGDPAGEENASHTPTSLFADTPADTPAPTETEAPKEEEPAEATTTTDGLDLSMFAQELPAGTVLNSPDDLLAHIKTMRESQVVVTELDRLGDEYPELVTAINSLHQGMTWDEIIANQAPSEVPDKNEDPDAYAAYMVRKARQEERQAASAKEQKRQADIQKRASKQAKQAWDRFVQDNGLTEAQQKEHLALYHSLYSGDPVTGAFRQDAFDIIQRGIQGGDPAQVAELQSEIEALKAQVAEAEKKGFINGARSVRDKARALPEPPRLDGAGNLTDDTLSPEDQVRKSLANAVTSSSRSWLDDAKRRGFRG